MTPGAEELVDKNIAAFVDGTKMEMSRPIGHDNIQEAVWDGHHRQHNLGFQGVTGPNGIILDVNGPHPGRRHDQFMLIESGINERMKNVQDQEGRRQRVRHTFACRYTLSRSNVE